MGQPGELMALEGDVFVEKLLTMLQKQVVLDGASPYVAIGTLTHVGGDYVELTDADMHDLRDSATSRENYLVKIVRHGLGVNRRRLVFRLAEVVAVSLLKDVSAE